jgi:hypothetical protein
MPPESALAPVALSAGQVNLANDSLSQQSGIVRSDDFTHELMPGNSGKTIVAPQQLEVCIADPAAQQPYRRVSFRPPRPRQGAQSGAAIFEMDSQHGR